MNKFFNLKTLAVVLLLASCSKESPELIPCMCDGSESTLGLFDCMCEPIKKKPVKKFSYIQDTIKPRHKTIVITEQEEEAYLYLHQRRDNFAPVKLEYVDFRIKKNGDYENYNTKLGNYRFRIFGCRRENKNVFLNEGRAMQKDMKFFDVFYETMNDFYPVVVEKSSPYYADSDKIAHPEYIMTAEITDYFMNICDEFDWNDVKQKKLRSGSSEITVVWRIMSLDKSEVYCKGMTTGYGQISEGEPNGETLLVERAFEDALTKVPEIQCFNRTLAQRIRPEEIERQLSMMRAHEVREQTVAGQYATVLEGVDMLQECAMNRPAVEQYIEPVPQETFAATFAQMRKPEIVMEDFVETVLEPAADIITTEVTEVDLEPRPAITENFGISGSGGTIKMDEECQMIAIDEASRTIVKNITTELQGQDNVTMIDDFWVDVPLDGEETTLVETQEMLESSYANTDNRFCIKNHPPYENMNPHNLYKVRASIVSVENANDVKGSGLIIADNLILTSADLMLKNNNNFSIRTINGKDMTATALRINPNKNVAILLLSEPTKFAPLPLSLSLPEINKDILMTLGLLDLDNEGEGYLDNEGKVIGYRWSESGDAEIIVDTFVQTVTLGGALIDKHGNIVGMAHKSKKSDENPDLFIPIETALKALGLEICGREFGTRKPAGFKAYETPLADAIDNSKDKAPIPMNSKEKK